MLIRRQANLLMSSIVLSFDMWYFFNFYLFIIICCLCYSYQDIFRKQYTVCWCHKSVIRQKTSHLLEDINTANRCIIMWCILSLRTTIEIRACTFLCHRYILMHVASRLDVCTRSIFLLNTPINLGIRFSPAGSASARTLVAALPSHFGGQLLL